MIRIYGIKNCSTVKKALDWLEKNGKEFEFIDYKKKPVSEEKLKDWEKQVSWDLLLNKKGTTWRKLPKEIQDSVTDAKSANAVLLENNSMIKRPIIEHGEDLIIGFDEEDYNAKLN